MALSTGIPLLLTFLVPINLLGLFECPFFAIAGLPCPFCGFTRSLWAISAGNWAFATINSPLSWLLYAGLVLVFAWNAGCLLLRNSNPFLLRLTRNQANHTAAVIICLVLFNWIYRLSLGLT
jgi:hypothetical protein